MPHPTVKWGMGEKRRSALTHLIACKVQHMDGPVMGAQGQQLVRNAQARCSVLAQDVCDAGPQALVLEPGLLLLPFLLFRGIPIRLGPLNQSAGVEL